MHAILLGLGLAGALYTGLHSLNVTMRTTAPGNNALNSRKH